LIFFLTATKVTRTPLNVMFICRSPVLLIPLPTETQADKTSFV